MRGPWIGYVQNTMPTGGYVAGSVNYHTLADFRVAHGEVLDELLTKSVAALIAEGLVSLERVAQDGKRVRASAGSSSFRRRPKLEQALAEAKQQVEALRQELETQPEATSKRQHAARERAVRERQERVAQALHATNPHEPRPPIPKRLG